VVDIAGLQWDPEEKRE